MTTTIDHISEIRKAVRAASSAAKRAEHSCYSVSQRLDFDTVPNDHMERRLVSTLEDEYRIAYAAVRTLKVAIESAIRVAQDGHRHEEPDEAMEDDDD